MASPSELTLDYKPNTNNTYPMIQKSFEDHQTEAQSQKIEDFLARLEEERLKIEAFKRELPLCMQLLNNAMETYRRQLETYQRCSQQGPPRPPVLEEFIPLSNMTINGSSTEKPPPATSEKANWMVSAQLWSPASDPAAAKQQHPLDIVPVKETYEMSTKLALDSKQRNGGAFLPFSKEKIGCKGPGLALASAAEKEAEEKRRSSETENGTVKRESGSGVVCHEQGIKGGNSSGEGQAAGGQSTHRKARRCWSPDLHRRFVNALQMLGGSQVATPKQIRELMKVDGLTNDEVKSHLQKYRLHTRRPIQPPQPPATAAPQLVVLGGIWVPSEYAAVAAAGGPTTIYGAHPAGPGAATHYPIPHDFYASPPPQHGHHHHHHHLHRAAVPHKARVHSPDSELRSGGDRSESIEEGEERDAEDEEEEEEEEMEEVKEDDNNRALVPVFDQSNGGGGGGGAGAGSGVALKF